jgi:polygalacturonase
MRPVQIDRRQFLALGTLACVSASARAAGARFSPESFGARGDGATDDYAAFQRLAAAVSRAGGGTISPAERALV